MAAPDSQPPSSYGAARNGTYCATSIVAGSGRSSPRQIAASSSRRCSAIVQRSNDSARPKLSSEVAMAARTVPNATDPSATGARAGRTVYDPKAVSILDDRLDGTEKTEA